MSVWKLARIGFCLSLVIPALGFANGPQSIGMGSSVIQISGPGVSQESFMNSLTDVSGLLRFFTPGSSNSVKVDSASVAGNQLTLKVEVKKYWSWHSADVSGNLRFNRAGCAAPSFGGTFTFSVNHARSIRNVSFRVCATSNPDHSLKVRVSQSLIAGPKYESYFAPIIGQIFAPAAPAITDHARSYAAAMDTQGPLYAAEPPAAALGLNR